MADPHDDLHTIAATDSSHDHPVTADDDDWKPALAKVNKELTKRINDLRSDNDKFQKTVSTSVQTLSTDVKSNKTGIENNKASIAAQDELIDEASKKADTAKAAADAAKKVADANAVKIAAIEAEHAAMKQALDELSAAYRTHTHDLTVTFQGETGRPKQEAA